MFEIFSRESESLISNPAFSVSLFAVLFLSVIVAIFHSEKKKLSSFRGISIFLISVILSVGTAIFIVVQIANLTKFESVWGNPTGKIYDNPFDVPEEELNDLKIVVLNEEYTEELLRENLGIDKVMISSGTYELFIEQDFADFTGVDYGDKGTSSDDITVSGIYYFTETEMVVITNYNSDNQETIVIPTH